MMASVSATVTDLSPATRAVIWRRGCMFVRGGQAFTLSDTELRKLVKASASVDAAVGGEAA